MDSALREACENGHAASAKWLIFAGADDYGHLESAFINQLLLDGPTRPDGPIRRRVDLRDIFAMLVQRRVYPRYGISNFWENLGAFTSPSYITFIVEKIIHNGMQLVQMLRGACRTGNTANVAFLIYYAQMYEAKSNKPIELDPLAMCHIARVGGHNHLIAPLLDGYEGPDSPALLLCAAAGGLLATVQAVLERKPGAVRRYPVRGFGSSTALSVADDPAVISALLAAGAEVNPVRCESTLRAACVGYRPESVRRLLAAGVDVNRTNYVEGVLELAITSPCAADRAEDKAEVIRLLLDAGATVVLDPGMTLGHLCVAQDRFTQPAVALRTILRHRPLLFSDNLLHNPQLMVLAVRQRNPAVVQALVDAGLSVHVLDTDGKPLIWCLLEQPLEAYGDAAAMREILDILLRAGADPTACDMQGQSLVMAIVEGVFGDVGRFAFYAIIDAILSKL
jgi:ankyrin repeat protein